MAVADDLNRLAAQDVVYLTNNMSSPAGGVRRPRPKCSEEGCDRRLMAIGCSMRLLVRTV